MATSRTGRTDEFTRQLRWRQTSGESLQDGDRVLITIRTPFILDRCCRPVDGTHVGGRVPLLPSCKPVHHEPDLCSTPPSGAGPWTSGTGTGAGVFESWFFVRENHERGKAGPGKGGTAMSVNAALAKPGCGCGGSGGCGCGCGCGSGAASANLAATAFVRPRFFAGQLLTEDDLAALADYTTAKDRLHNRYLFGAGVVCGLWVSCDPCGGGTVTVQPGYALDCCGNDLILRCAATLDVNAMIRDLRAAQLGKDCGDPCADQGTSSAGRQGTPVTRHYRLYARYGEQETDPVAPYATGDQCGPVACEPTRIREGISFVLKCPAKTRRRRMICRCRLRACLPGAWRFSAARYGSRQYSGPMAAAMRRGRTPARFRPGRSR